MIINIFTFQCHWCIFRVVQPPLKVHAGGPPPDGWRIKCQCHQLARMMPQVYTEYYAEYHAHLRNTHRIFPFFQENVRCGPFPGYVQCVLLTGTGHYGCRDRRRMPPINVLSNWIHAFRKNSKNNFRPSSVWHQDKNLDGFAALTAALWAAKDLVEPKSPVTMPYDTRSVIESLDISFSPPPDFIVKEYRRFLEAPILEPEVQIHVSTQAGRTSTPFCVTCKEYS